MRVRQDVSSYLSNRTGLETRLLKSYQALGIEFPEQVDAGPVAQRSSAEDGHGRQW